MPKEQTFLYCCPRCFGDPGLSEIIKAHADQTSQCPNCDSNEVEVAEIKHVKEPFRLVADAYSSTSESSSSLLECFKNDWNLFGNNALSEEKQSGLLLEILGDRKLSGSYEPLLGDFGQDENGDYQRFRNEIITQNRWFIENTVLVDDSQEFLSSLIYVLKPGEVLYRARIQDNPDTPFLTAEMGAPPPELAVAGRSNPAGISYFYLASDIDTALSEVRSQAGHYVSVGKFEFENLKVVDFSDMRDTYSPFLLDETAKVRAHAEKLALFEAVAVEMSKPVTGRQELEYLPTQYVCEMLKSFGFEGVRYRSSQGEGRNFVLFGRRDSNAVSVETMKINKLRIEKEKHPKNSISISGKSLGTSSFPL